MKFLVKTKLRRKLLAHSFTHPDENFYVRELAALIGEDPGNLSRELRRLEEDGLYRSSIRAKARFYSLNKDYPLFDELKKIIFKTEGVAGSLKNLVDPFEGISLAFLHGSYARGEEKKTSDIDFVLVGRFPVNEVTRKIRELESKLNREINFTAYTPEEFARESQKKGSFLNLVIQNKIIILKGRLHAR